MPNDDSPSHLCSHFHRCMTCVHAFQGVTFNNSGCFAFLQFLLALIPSFECCPTNYASPIKWSNFLKIFVSFIFPGQILKGNLIILGSWGPDPVGRSRPLPKGEVNRVKGEGWGATLNNVRVTNHFVTTHSLMKNFKQQIAETTNAPSKQHRKE